MYGRACRLVVDTGIHYKWTRGQVVQFLRDHSSQNKLLPFRTDRSSPGEETSTGVQDR